MHRNYLKLPPHEKRHGGAEYRIMLKKREETDRKKAAEFAHDKWRLHVE